MPQTVSAVQPRSTRGSHERLSYWNELQTEQAPQSEFKVPLQEPLRTVWPEGHTVQAVQPRSLVLVGAMFWY